MSNAASETRAKMVVQDFGAMTESSINLQDLENGGQGLAIWDEYRLSMWVFVSKIVVLYKITLLGKH